MQTETNRGGIGGIHHITAIASSAADNLTFYTRVLGLRLVKKTVNFDDPYTYHLYYGDTIGSPGTILTFFPWERLPSGRTGAGTGTSVTFAVPIESLDYWVERLTGNGVAVRLTNTFGETAIQFYDPQGLPLALVGTSLPFSAVLWRKGPIPETHAVRGFHSAALLLNEFEGTRTLLSDVLGMTIVQRADNRFRFAFSGDSGAGRFLDIIVDAAAPRGLQGAGSIHHIALRTDSPGAQRAWQGKLREAGYPVTPVRDRKYFQSIYFHEPGGVLFEIATDSPGFAVDEKPEHLGTALMLPTQYEALRAEIEHRLPKLPETTGNRYRRIQTWHKSYPTPTEG
jgi:glyoxalase family protein